MPSDTTVHASGRFSGWTDNQLTDAVAEAGSYRALGKQLGVPWTTIYGECRKRGVKPPGSRAPVPPPVTETIRPASRPAFSDAAIVREAGADPALFEVSGITSTETDTDMGTMSSRKVSLRPRKLTIAPASDAPGYAPPPPAWVPGTKQTWVVLSDQHAPHHDPALHAIACQVLEELRPDGVLLLGDLMDLSGSISRHPNLPGTPSLQDNLDAAYSLLCDYRTAAGDEARFVLLEGNHDKRIWSYVSNQASVLEGVSIAGGGAPALSVPHLLRLDELGVEFLGVDDMPGGGYPLATWEVIPERLVAIHGNRARKGAGNSALSTARDRGHGVIHGHTHRLAVSAFTLYGTDGTPRPFHAVEAGTMASVKGGMRYAPQESADWQAGFVVMTIWEDGAHSFEPAMFAGDCLTLRDRRYRVDGERVVIS